MGTRASPAGRISWSAALRVPPYKAEVTLPHSKTSHHFVPVALMAVESMLKKGISPSSWHHAPEHRFIPGKTYLVTGATLYKQHFLASSERLGFLQSHLFDFATRVGWNLQAWAIFSNHYHFIAESLLDAYPLSRFIQRFHSDSARLLNLKDDQIGRKVWYQYWDRCLTFETSYLARLNYVNNNAVTGTRSCCHCQPVSFLLCRVVRSSLFPLFSTQSSFLRVRTPERTR